MPAYITFGWESPVKAVKSEEHLRTLLEDLRDLYREISKGFEIRDGTGKVIVDARSFLKSAVSCRAPLTIEGSGIVSGIEIRRGIAKYDVSNALFTAGNWDALRNGTCYGCNNIRRYFSGPDEGTLICNLESTDKDLPKSKTCDHYTPRVAGTQGNFPRTLDELISEVCD